MSARTCAAAICLICHATAQDPQPEPARIEVGSPVTGTITPSSTVVTTPAIARQADEKRSDEPCRGVPHVLRVPADGRYCIELSAGLFDAYLVLRSDGGEVLAEDNDGLLVTHARIEVDLQQDRSYRVEACALHGRTGEYRLQVKAGAAPQLGQLARITASIREAKAMLEERDAQLDPNHHLIAIACDTLGTYYWQVGNYKAALPLMERALAIYQHNQTGDGFVAYAHIEIGAQLEGLRRPAEARPHFERAIALLEALADPHLPHLCLALNNMALLEQRSGRPAEAERLLRRRLELSEQRLGADHTDTATACNNLGHLLLETGRTDLAEPLLRRALDIRRTRLRADDPVVAFTLTNLGILEMQRGRPRQALAHFEEALRIRSAALPDPHPETVEALANTGQALHELGRYTEAEQMLRRAARSAPLVFPPGSPEPLRIQLSLSSVLEQQGRLEEAVALGRKVVAALERSERAPDRLYVGALHALSSAVFRLQEEQGQQPDDECVGLFERSKATCAEVLGTDTEDYGYVLNNFSAMLLARRQLAEGEAMLQECLALRTRLHGEHAFLTASVRNNLANVLQLQGRHGEAEPLRRQALAAVDDALGSAHPQAISGRVNLAQLLQETGRLDEAVQLARESASDNTMLLAELLASGDEANALHHAEQIRQGIEAFEALSILQGDRQRIDEAFARLMQWQGQVFRVSRDLRRRLAELAGRRQVELAELRRLQDQIAAMLQAGRGASREQLQELVERRRQVEAELVQGLRAGLPQPATVADIAAALPAGAALVDLQTRANYVVGRFVDGRYQADPAAKAAQLTAWVVRAGDPHVTPVSLGPAPPIEASVREHLRRLWVDAGRGDDAHAPGAGRDPSARAGAAESTELHRLLWQPIAAALAGAEQVWVFAGGVLGRLPLETIRSAEGKFLIESHSFVYLDGPDALVSPMTRGAPDASPSLLVVGAVDYGPVPVPAAGSPAADGVSPAAAVWRPLPATAAEADAVAAAWRASRPDATLLELKAGDATASRLRSALPEHTVVHLATHARFDSTAAVGKDMAGLQASLVCAGANNAANAADAMLTAEEVAWLELSGVRLVVLSACETSLGLELAASRMSLRRAFHVAGAQDVVSSMWPVPDQATADLMRDFYDRHLLRGQQPGVALRDARLQMLQHYRSGKDGDPQPGKWGAWVYSTIR